MKTCARLQLICGVLALLGIAVAVAAAPAPQSPAQTFLKRLGLVLMEAGQYQAIDVNPTPLTRSLPPSVDLSGDMPPVGDQGNQDSCVAWSTGYAARTYLERMELQRQWNVAIPAAQFSPAFVYNQLARGNCTTGVTIASALDLMSTQGVATLSTMPYSDTDCQSQPSAPVAQYAAQFKISGYRRINPQDLNVVKAHLAAGIPVVVALDVDNAFMTLGRNQEWASKGPTVGSHAVVLTGYNDAQHVFMLINSWGRNWGTDGYGYVDYNLFPSVAREAYIITPFHSHEQTNQAREASVQIQSLTIVPGMTPGMNAQIAFSLGGYAGHTGLVVLYFWYQNRQPVGATVPSLADIAGNAAIATQTFAIQSNAATNYAVTQFIPTADLNVPMGQNVLYGGRVMYQPAVTTLLVRAELFVDNYGMAQSQYFSFSVAR